MRRLLLITTGGTIASVQGNLGLTPGNDYAQIEQYLRSSSLSCEIRRLSLFDIDSTNMQPENWVEIAATVAAHYDEYDGFLITHGTDTMAYTAAAISYFLQGLAKPVILTGSQAPFDNQKTDARRNLRDAVRVAMEEIGGVFVVFDGKIIAGTRAVKIRTKSFDAFESVNFPDVGHMEDGIIKYRINLAPTGEALRFDASLVTDVALIKLYPGIHPDLLDRVADGVRGLVIESFGNGGIPSLQRNLLPSIERLTAKGVAVVVTTQCLQEGEDLSLYEVGRRVMLIPHVIVSKDMNTEAIVPKLMWVLGKTNDLAAVKALMETPIAFDCSF